MKTFQYIVVAIVLLLAARPGYGADNSPQATPNPELEGTFAKYAEAAKLFYDGKPEAVKAMWSHGDDVTLSGAAGGETARGWKNVSERLDWASSQFSRGSKAVELIQQTVSGDFAYVVQYEHILFYPPGQTRQSKRDYRVTTIFRREPEGWRVVHRHADTLLKREAIK
ncbi:MAG TPA: nuclear transport factor 2 family protein [Lysobacter sp.]